MKIKASLLGAIGAFVSVSSLAVYTVRTSETAVDADCVECGTVYHGDGTSTPTCRAKDDQLTGPRLCEFINGSCTASGYATCSG